jgi:predicted TIM-barrel fold metal-dependent hydrolase
MANRYCYLLVLVLLAALAVCGAADRASAQGSAIAIIDVHTHLVPGPGMRFEDSVATAVKLMDRYRVGTSIVMSPPRKAGIRQNYDAADFRAVLKKYPGRFVYLGGGGTLNPMLHSNSDPARVTAQVRTKFAAEARRLIDGGAKGFGEIGSLHISLSRQHGYTYVPADHPLLKLLADIAAERGVPIDLHMDAARSEMTPPPQLAKFPNNPQKFPATLEGLEGLLSHNRKAIIVWAHCGTDHLGDFNAGTVAGLMQRHANLYLSLKVTGPRAQTLNKLFSPGRLDPEWRALFERFPDRFTIGTDNFYADPKGQGPTMEFSRKAEPRLQATAAFLSLLPPGLARKIGRDNAIKLYRLNSREAPASIPNPSAVSPTPAPVGRERKRLCRHGNMAHCKVACQRGVQAACAQLKRGR